ncbi:flagellar protein FliT [Lentibacillus cibarius]|uniref:Flagellar protein FliT n=1 Tax=Lentibacillus cibarius TaxID=2583219 RepID=A0A549YEA9_9BACI|nr:flagellar protein FliT [Lentibacillus cibarius]TMN21350.1 flagellar protein FliT [Lentibacillus cibarius]TRM10229.1 flagellar protein FliT [Lentibacillus cibarius]
MNRLQNLWDTTNLLHDVLTEAMETKNREKNIERINELVEYRGELLQQVVPPFTDDEKRLGKQLILLNEQVQEKMDTLFTTLKQEMKQMKKQKKSNRTYIDPYEHVKTIDGMFLDSKK